MDRIARENQKVRERKTSNVKKSQDPLVTIFSFAQLSALIVNFTSGFKISGVSMAISWYFLAE